MKPIYEIIETPMGNTTINALFPDGRMLSIPADPANSDYQRYLAWLENPEAEETSTIGVTE